MSSYSDLQGKTTGPRTTKYKIHSSAMQWNKRCALNSICQNNSCILRIWTIFINHFEIQVNIVNCIYYRPNKFPCEYTKRIVFITYLIDCELLSHFHIIFSSSTTANFVDCDCEIIIIILFKTLITYINSHWLTTKKNNKKIKNLPLSYHFFQAHKHHIATCYWDQCLLIALIPL